MEQAKNISDAEMVIMRVIWALKKARVDEIVSQISKRQKWSKATVKTLLGRLVKKKILKTKKDGRAFIYYSVVTEDEIIQFLSINLMEKICETKHSLVILENIKQAKLTESDVAVLKKELFKKERVGNIQCSCLDNYCQDCQHK
ncbi:MAG: BlaI/MecI/CopY family transcriptional regulator [Lactovum sp.]